MNGMEAICAICDDTMTIFNRFITWCKDLPESRGFFGIDGYGSPNERLFTVWEQLNVGASAGLNWWICRPSLTILSPWAMWKFPATLFTRIVPETWHPSPCSACAFTALFISRRHCSEVASEKRPQPLLSYAAFSSSQVLQHLGKYTLKIIPTSWWSQANLLSLLSFCSVAGTAIVGSQLCLQLCLKETEWVTRHKNILDLRDFPPVHRQLMMSVLQSIFRHRWCVV